MLNKVIVLAIAAGFATASFAQSGAPAGSPAPAAKVAPAAATAEKKVETAKAAEPAKTETAKTATPAKAEVAKTEAPRTNAKPVAIKHQEKKLTQAEAKPEAPAPAAK